MALLGILQFFRARPLSLLSFSGAPILSSFRAKSRCYGNRPDWEMDEKGQVSKPETCPRAVILPQKSPDFRRYQLELTSLTAPVAVAIR